MRTQFSLEFNDPDHTLSSFRCWFFFFIAAAAAAVCCRFNRKRHPPVMCCVNDLKTHYPRQMHFIEWWTKGSVFALHTDSLLPPSINWHTSNTFVRELICQMCMANGMHTQRSVHEVCIAPSSNLDKTRARTQ